MPSVGYLKFFKPEPGYGFIIPDDGGPDVFVHATAGDAAGLQLREGMRLSYEAITTPRGTKAVNLGRPK